MIGTSTAEYIGIRACIAALRAVAPLSLIYLCLLPLIPVTVSVWPVAASIWPAAEAAFFVLVYLPRRWRLQRPAVHPPLPPRPARAALYHRCLAVLPDPVRYLSAWFRDAAPDDIRRENLVEFFSWAFLNADGVPATGPLRDEMEGYVDEFTRVHSHTLAEGRGPATCLRLTLDPVLMTHRPLAWYGIVSLVDGITHFQLLYHGFRYYRTPVLAFPFVFPWRPLTLLPGARPSPARLLSYWHHSGCSAPSSASASARLPVVFLHGIGVGLWPYVDFLAALQDADGAEILVVEILPISARITGSALTKEEMCGQIRRILSHHGIDRFVLVAHSYGSCIATHLLQDSTVSEQIASVVLVDPVTILLHLPHVAYNFTHRRPTCANEWQLWYFACSDMGVAHTLFRAFFWWQNIIWRSDVDANVPVTVFLAERDQVVDTASVRHYLTQRDEVGEDDEGQGRDIGAWKTVWCDGLDHAQVFDSAQWRSVLIEEVLRLSRLEIDD